jgi:hypothetical protein
MMSGNRSALAVPYTDRLLSYFFFVVFFAVALAVVFFAVVFFVAAFFTGIFFPPYIYYVRFYFFVKSNNSNLIPD